LRTLPVRLLTPFHGRSIGGMKVSRLALPAAVSLLIFGIGSTAYAAPRYEIHLDERDPLLVQASIHNPAKILRIAALSQQREGARRNSPACHGRVLAELSPGAWQVPAGCERVDWSTRISPLNESSAYDIAAPGSVWDQEAGLWILTSSLPWLRGDGQDSASVRISARLGGKSVSSTAVLPRDRSIPVAIVVGRPVRTFAADGFTIRGFGHLPTAEADSWQRQLASILADWRRDLLPAGTSTPARMNYVWLPRPIAGEPGLNASANSGSVLMQYIPAPNDIVPGPRLKVGILMVGAHEAFHVLGAVRGGPAWVNESLATYFAVRSARPYLDQESLQLVQEFVNARDGRSLLNLQRAFNVGDGSAYPSFYAKGARFWAAIERVLAVRPNGSGKLSALIRQTEGLKGIDWSDGDQIAEYLDRYSEGRARAVVRCFVIEDNCPIAGDPI